MAACFNPTGSSSGDKMYKYKMVVGQIVMVFFSLQLFTIIFIFTSVSLVSLCKYLFKLVERTIS